MDRKFKNSLKKTKEIKEFCEKCNDISMVMDSATIEGITGFESWICDTCGFSEARPTDRSRFIDKNSEFY